MIDKVVSGMRGRIERCRRLAEQVTDPVVSRALLEMADEGEAAIQELLSPPPQGLDRPRFI
jgi:hypothetical protein